jgi:5,10-methylenetetrahydrofolate reductase
VTGPGGFAVVCEVDPPTRPDLRPVRHQIGVLAPVADAFVIPDNHLGRATVSSIAVAREVQAMGSRAIACLNCRDRNLLGLRRDLLTAAAYGVADLLCVYGDAPAAGARTSQLGVRGMLEEIGEGAVGPFRAGVTTRLGPVPEWKRRADFTFVQVSFSVEQIVAWREREGVTGPVFAGVLVLSSAAMARRIDALPEIDVPSALLADLARDPSAGVEVACTMVRDLARSGAVEGVHLVPVGRFREVAARLAADREAVDGQVPAAPDGVQRDRVSSRGSPA